MTAYAESINMIASEEANKLTQTTLQNLDQIHDWWTHYIRSNRDDDAHALEQQPMHQEAN